MCKRSKGFTLIELLAVIVILAIIALIVTPVILNVIENSRDKSNINSTYGIVKAADIYYTEHVFDETMTLNSGEEKNILSLLKFTGKKPSQGYVYLNEDGDVYVAVAYDDKCYMKDYDDEEVKKTEDVTKCGIILENTGNVTENENSDEPELVSCDNVLSNGSASDSMI